VILGTAPLVEGDHPRRHPGRLEVGLGAQKRTVGRQIKQSLGHGDLSPSLSIATLHPGIGHPKQHQTRSADAGLGGRRVDRVGLREHPEPEAVVQVDAHHRVVLGGGGVLRQRLGHEAHSAGEHVVPEDAVAALERPQKTAAAVQLGALLVQRRLVRPSQRQDDVEDEEVEFAGHRLRVLTT
jgi:hypothetical protein